MLMLHSAMLATSVLHRLHPTAKQPRAFPSVTRHKAVLGIERRCLQSLPALQPCNTSIPHSLGIDRRYCVALLPAMPLHSPQQQLFRNWARVSILECAMS